MLGMKNKQCREIWSWNRNEEMSLIEDCLRNYRFIAIDTKFPGCLRETSQNATVDERYNNMSTWEINFSDFGVDDARNEKSIEFLRRNGLDLRKIREEGIGIKGFFSELFWILKKARNITWVTFHGYYDIAYLLKCFTGEALPYTPKRFSKAVARILGSVYDLNVMAGQHQGLSSRLGLESLAHELELNRVGTAHHAGSDRELTAQIFAKMAKIFNNVQESEGHVYGLGYRVISDHLKKKQHMNHVTRTSFYGPPPPPPPPFPLLRPMFVPGFPPFGGFVLMPRVSLS
ncbi:hypothetical protein ARALYDRAFT_905530 [Arabidopsis lyrata subsp. lyrata]|uniref:poly(A)-specific ribonuclease n=1 Tax=Arabidopsis lyrata subsp. lyrata TaxID=81972 RepID=D7LNP9_ARALL|nr:hypothetical protein ARALYDRAFT_905530 [Arabidopsis lyrata subsp. lyrata]